MKKKPKVIKKEENAFVFDKSNTVTILNEKGKEALLSTYKFKMDISSETMIGLVTEALKKDYAIDPNATIEIEQNADDYGVQPGFVVTMTIDQVTEIPSAPTVKKIKK